MDIKARDNSLDVLRGLAIISVLMIHVTADYVYADAGSLTYAVMNVVDKVFHCAVPTFVTLTVYLALKSGRKLGPSYVLRKAGPLVLMYVVWSALYMIAQYIAYSVPIPGPKELIFNYLLQGQACYHLYYVVMLIQLYVVIAILSRLPIKRLHPRWWMLPAAILAQAVILVLFIKFIILRFWFYNTAIFPIFYVLPITIGVMLAADDERTKGLFRSCGPVFGICWGFGLALFAWFSAGGSQAFGTGFYAGSLFNTVATAVFNVGGVPLMFLLAEKLKNVSPLSLMGRHSLTIYFAHPMALYLMDAAYNIRTGSPIQLAVGIGVRAILIIALSLGYAYCAQKVKSHNLFKNLRQS